MRIAHVVWGMRTGGVETMLVNIINEHVKTDTVRLYIVNDFVDEDVIDKVSDKCKIYRVNRRPKSKNPLGIIRLNIWLRTFCPDIIHVHSYRISKLIFGKWNIVRTIHGMNNVPDEYPKMKALYAISHAVKEYTIEQGFANVIEIDNGIHIESFTSKFSNKPKEKYKIVQVGRLYTPHKGQDIVLRALSKLTHEGIRNFSMHFIGDGASKEDLLELANSLGIQDYVVFEGRKTQDEIYHNLSDYDLFVQPSRTEGFGLSVAEAIAAKLPVLISDITGPMEIIGNGKYGLYFRTGSYEDMSNKLKTILQGGYDYSMIDSAYDFVKTHYDVSITAKRYLEEYKKVINR